MTTNAYYIDAPGGGGGGTVPTTAFPLLGPNGSAAAPSYSFVNLTTMGMFYDSANNALGLSVGTAGNILEIQNTSGAFPGSILIGANGQTTGVRLIPTAGLLTLQTGNNAGNAAFATSGSVQAGTYVAAGNLNTTAGSAVLQLGDGGYAGYLATAANSSGLHYMSSGILLTGVRWVVAKTTSYTLGTAGTDIGALFTNTGATGTITLSLPTAALGDFYDVTCTAAYDIIISGAGNVVTAFLTSGTSRTLQGSSTQYTSARVTCYDGTNWVLTGCTGSII